VLIHSVSGCDGCGSVGLAGLGPDASALFVRRRWATPPGTASAARHGRTTPGLDGIDGIDEPEYQFAERASLRERHAVVIDLYLDVVVADHRDRAGGFEDDKAVGQQGQDADRLVRAIDQC
jgi:hypothetical protein